MVGLSASFASIPGTTPGQAATVCSFRDITLEKDAQSRRASAAVVTAGLTGADDLETLLGVAQHGLELLFDGASTIQLNLGDRYLFSGGTVSLPKDWPMTPGQDWLACRAPTRCVSGRACCWSR